MDDVKDIVMPRLKHLQQSTPVEWDLSFVKKGKTEYVRYIETHSEFDGEPFSYGIDAAGHQTIFVGPKVITGKPSKATHAMFKFVVEEKYNHKVMPII